MEKLYDSAPVAVDCHPSGRLLGIGFIDGTVSISSYRFSEKEQRGRRTVNGAGEGNVSNSRLVLKDVHVRRHKRAVRRVQFTPCNGDQLIVITKNRALCQWDVESGRKLRCIRVAHEEPPFALRCVTDDQIATGDEAGIVKLWDWRVSSPCVATFDDTHGDIVNDLASSEDNRTLLAVSGDGSLSAFSIKNKAVQVQSEEMHAELLSVAITKNGTKVVCGSGEGGYVEIFNWNEFGNISERMQTGHPDSVDRLVSIDRSGLVASASIMDGTIRLLRVGKNGKLGIIGQHQDNDGDCAAIEDLSITSDCSYLVSCGQDQKVKFWNLDALTRQFYANDSDDECEGQSVAKKRRKRMQKLNSKSESFFDGLMQETNAAANGEHGGSSGESDSDDD